MQQFRNIYGLPIGTLLNLELLLIISLITLSSFACCKKKKKGLSAESRKPEYVAFSNPPTENGTEDIVAGAETGVSSRPMTSQVKDTTQENEKDKSQIKTAKGMPKNVWDLCYPPTTEQTLTVDETRGIGGTVDATKKTE